MKKIIISLVSVFCVFTMSFYFVNASEDFNHPQDVSVEKAGSHLKIAWNDSRDESVVGYNIYKSENEGEQGNFLHYFKDICSIYNGCDYVDQEVELNKEYFYIVKSVNSDGIESTNNDQHKGVVVLAESEKPDLIIKDIYLDGYEAGSKKYDLNKEVKLSISYYNQGGGISEKNKIGFYYDNELISKIDTHDMIGIFYGQYKSDGPSQWDYHYSSSVALILQDSGDHVITAVIDDGNIIDEQNENNNTFEKTITIKGDSPSKQDLSFREESFKYYISEGNDGYSKGTRLAYIEVEDKNKVEKFTQGFFSFKASMNGVTEVFAPKVVSDYVLGFTINLVFFGTLNSNQQYDINFSIDTDNIVDESNENNNTFEKTIIINNDDPIITNNTTENTTNNTINDETTPTTNNPVSNLILKLTRKISALENQVIALEKKLTILDQKFADKYAGTMFLDVENHGRLWYVDPASKNRYYFENGEGALSIGSKLATGITYENIQKIPIGVPEKLYNLKDSDGDSLSDRLESALGTDPNKTDTDGDGFSDKDEVNSGYNPLNNEKYSYSQSLADRFEGKMLLQVSGPNSHGEIWYIHDGKRWYGGTEDSMYEIMKAQSLGATAENIRKISVGEVESEE